MKDKAFEKQVNQDIDQTKKDIATLGEDNVAGLARITKDLTALKEDGVTGLGRKFEQVTGEAKEMVSDAVNTLNKDVGKGLNQYNAKVQAVANRLPGGFSKKAAGYPWVTITISLVLGLLLGILLKPGRQSFVG